MVVSQEGDRLVVLRSATLSPRQDGRLKLTLAPCDFEGIRIGERRHGHMISQLQ